MAQRTKYSCSIISYVPDYIRGEQFNIGVLMLSDRGVILDFTLLPQNTSKLNSIMVSSDDKILFKETLALLEVILENYKNGFPIDTKIDKNTLILKGLPDTVRLSSLIYGVSSNLSMVLRHLVDVYVGTEYFGKNHKVKSQAKEFAQTYFEKNKFTEKNLVLRATFKPSPAVPFKYTADYAYLNEQKTLSIISTLPSSEESLDTWYQKNNLLTRQFEEYGDIVYLYDKVKFAVEKQQILTDLKSQNNALKIFDIQNDIQNFTDFSKKTLANSQKQSVQDFLKKLA